MNVTLDAPHLFALAAALVVVLEPPADSGPRSRVTRVPSVVISPDAGPRATTTIITSPSKSTPSMKIAGNRTPSKRRSASA